MKKTLVLLLILVMTLSLAVPAFAEWVPDKEIKCIVPFGPGGGSDILSRTLIEYMDLPVDMVVVNIEGGAGLVGAQETAVAEPDGYTILAHNPMNLIGQGLTGTSELWQELTMLAFVVDDWTVVSTNKETGWTSVDDFVAYATENPGEVKWGVTGSGITVADTYNSIAALDIDCTVVPYDGGAESRSALLGNHIQVEMSTSSDIAAYVASGDVIPLFVIAPGRCPSLPDVPTMVELGYDVDTGAPRAYFAPGDLDPDALAFWESKFQEVCENPDFVEACANLGFVVQYVGSEEGTKRMHNWFDTKLPVFIELGFAQ